MELSMSQAVAIIPCAGFGTRMGMSPDKSKELLPLANGKPLIEHHLDICRNLKIKPVILIREEKRDLLDFCRSRKIQTVLIDPKGEWTSTVLQSQRVWGIRNLLMLPDTLYSPENTGKFLLQGLYDGADVAIATHSPSDLSNWGVVRSSGAGVLSLCEKPKDPTPATDKAWGLLGFTKHSGFKLFTGFESKQWFTIDNAFVVDMLNFKDVTRGNHA